WPLRQSVRGAAPPMDGGPKRRAVPIPLVAAPHSSPTGQRRACDAPTPNLRRGKAITCAMKGTVTPSTSSAAVKLNDDGSLSVLTSSVEMGQGAKTVLAQIAAEEAGLPLEQVSVSEPDTDTTPYDQQTTSSRTTFSMG